MQQEGPYSQQNADGSATCHRRHLSRFYGNVRCFAGFRQIINNFDLQWESDHVKISLPNDEDRQSLAPVEIEPGEEVADSDEPADTGTAAAVQEREEGSDSNLFAPTYIPEGFELAEIQYHGSATFLDYEKDNQDIRISRYSSGVNISVDTERAEYFFDYQVQGYPAITAVWANDTSIFWNDNEHVFHLTAPSSLGIEEILRIANSITYQEEYFLENQPPMDSQ